MVELSIMPKKLRLKYAQSSQISVFYVTVIDLCYFALNMISIEKKMFSSMFQFISSYLLATLYLMLQNDTNPAKYDDGVDFV